MLRKLCDKYGLLLIADEVITGFGRTGRWFGMENWNVNADLMIFAKGVTSGYLPLSGVMLTHANMISNVIDSPKDLEFGESDAALSVLPLSHILERQAMNNYLHYGMSVYFAESLDTIGANVREVKPTVLVGVPRLYEKIYERAKDRANARGKLSAALFSWAVDVGAEWAQISFNHQRVSFLLSLKHKIADLLVFKNRRTVHWPLQRGQGAQHDITSPAPLTLGCFRRIAERIMETAQRLKDPIRTHTLRKPDFLRVVRLPFPPHPRTASTGKAATPGRGGQAARDPAAGPPRPRCRRAAPAGRLR